MTKCNIGEKIEQALHENHLTVAKAAKQLGIDEKQLRCWIHNTPAPSLEDLLFIMELTKTDVSYFIQDIPHGGKDFRLFAPYAFPQELEERIENLEQVLFHLLCNQKG